MQRPSGERAPVTTERRGPFDRVLRTSGEPPKPSGPDRGVIYIVGTIVGLAILLLVLLLPPVSILSRGGGGSSSIPSGPATADTYTATRRSGMPKLPPGLVAVSAQFDLAAPADQQGASRITVKLTQTQTDTHNLAMYSYVDAKWQRLGDAQLVASGDAARADVSALPGNIAVLRRTKATLQVAGSIPSGTTLSKAAESVITTLHPIVFIPAADGGIAGTSPGVPPAGYKVVPVIVALSPDTVDNILRSSDLQAKHAAAIADRVKGGNFAGIDVDYRNVNGSLGTQFTTFVATLAKALHADGRTLTLTLPMPTNANGTLTTGAYDWEALGKSADTIELAGELDQDLYFQETEAALNYVTQKVDRSKLLLTISSQSIERGGDGLTSMPLNDALSLASAVSVTPAGDIAPGAKMTLSAQNLAASEGASGLHWDDISRSVTFSYAGRGGKRTVWIENQFSAAFRVDLAQRFQLGGVSVSDVSDQGGGADVWAPIQQVSDTGALTLARPNGELLTPAWTTTDGVLTPQTGESVSWTAPAAAGTYTVTVIVSDGVIRAGQNVALDVIVPSTQPAQ